MASTASPSPAARRQTTTFLETLLLILSLTNLAAAQTWTNCNPMKKDCPADPALSTNATFDFANNIASTKIWNTTAGPINYTPQGAEFQIQDNTMAPTIQSKFYIFFGRVETIMQAAHGVGIVSSVVLQSDDLDEIDWEFVGGNLTSVQSNYYGKGNTTTYDRGRYHPLKLAPQDNFYNYTTVWTSEKLEWWVNGTLLRTLNFNDAVGGSQYPQTPMTVRLGAWPAGRKGNNKGTIEWAGGYTDFSQGQTYTMTVKSLYVQDYGSGREYTYSDRSGDWESIKAVAGNSTAAQYIWEPHGVKAHWNALPKAAQIAIIAGVLGVAALLFLLMVFCCIKQRRAGRREKKIADAEFEKGAAELMDYRRKAAAGAYGLTSNVVSSHRAESIRSGQPSPHQTPKLPQVSIMEPGRTMRSGWL